MSVGGGGDGSFLLTYGKSRRRDQTLLPTAQDMVMMTKAHEDICVLLRVKNQTCKFCME